MKRIFFITLIASLFLTGCHKKSEQDVLKENLRACAEKYVKEELQISNADSVVVHVTDTVTELGYSRLVLEMLENLEGQYKMMYDEATLADDDSKIEYLEMYLRQISTQLDYFRAIEETESADNEQLLLYLISGSYYQNGNGNDFICFANPNFSIHILDPFADNLLQ